MVSRAFVPIEGVQQPFMPILSQRTSRPYFPKLLVLAWITLPIAAQTPQLPPISETPQSVPYLWKNVMIRAGGFISGLLFSPTQKGLVYARTDVGGAYRSTDAGEHWTAITDQFGREEDNFLGIESMAVDPNDAKKLYLAVGMYSADWGGPAAILRSDDQGATYQMTRMPFKMGGNDNGRGCGERLAVDPNLGSVLFFGSRKAGLWKSTDSGATWNKVESFPVTGKVTGVGQDTGITFVVFEAASGTTGKATPVLYAGVAQADSGLYRSKDGGETWELVPGAPAGLFPSHGVVLPGKAIYFSYVNNVGPNDITDGSVQRLTLADGKWKDLSPVKPGGEGQGKFGFGGITMDAEHPNTLMVTTIDRWWPGDTVFRTTDGGKHWKDGFDGSTFTASAVPWVYRHHETITRTHWMNDIKIDPFDSGKVMLTSGEGIWGSANMTALDTGKQVHWGFPNEGIEEVVPVGIVSPPQGAPLLSVVGDLDGFRHEDLRRSPAGGSFSNPTYSGGTSIDFAQSDPKIIVRVGNGDPKVVHGVYSLDNGVTWKPFANEVPGSDKGGGTVAISADGKTVVWTPYHGVPQWTADWGRNWSACAGLNDKMRVVADRVNPVKFYSFDLEMGQFLESLDGAHSFNVRTEPVSAPKARYAKIAPNPLREGDLWIAAGGKVYHSSDSGVTFVELVGMTDVQTLGFGRPAAGSTTPMIVMNGTAVGVEGTFRSYDDGLSWVRIDDAMHQFGWKNAVIGDPRVTGRVYVATGGRGILYGEPAK